MRENNTLLLTKMQKGETSAPKGHLRLFHLTLPQKYHPHAIEGYLALSSAAFHIENSPEFGLQLSSYSAIT
jgi:hypothetical protein